MAETTTERVVAGAQAGSRFWTVRRRAALEGYLYLLPWAIGFLAFIAYPMVTSLWLSFHKFNVLTSAEFIGLKNYVQALTLDKLFWPSLGRTFYFALVSVPLGLAASLFVAMLLNQRLKGTNLLRTAFFLPTLVPVVATAVLWRWIMQPQIGLANLLLSYVGIAGPNWLGSVEWAIPSLIIVSLWGTVGGSRMIIFLAGLQGVPQELYEAAQIDGAGRWAQFQHVTLPMLSPVMFFNLVLGVIAALRSFDLAYVATNGGPAYATWFYSIHIYQNAFVSFDMGYAAALAWLFFVVMLLFTWIQFRASASWVFYAADDRK